MRYIYLLEYHTHDGNSSYEEISAYATRALAQKALEQAIADEIADQLDYGDLTEKGDGNYLFKGEEITFPNEISKNGLWLDDAWGYSVSIFIKAVVLQGE